MKKISRNNLRKSRIRRIRFKIKGTAKVPRLSVFKSLTGIYAQAIDDENMKTLCSVSSKKIVGKKKGQELAEEVGKLIAKECSKIKIEKVVFDRSGYKYHGKVKALAEGARKGGLKF